MGCSQSGEFLAPPDDGAWDEAGNRRKTWCGKAATEGARVCPQDYPQHFWMLRLTATAATGALHTVALRSLIRCNSKQ